jgi:hypothetical protein
MIKKFPFTLLLEIFPNSFVQNIITFIIFPQVQPNNNEVSFILLEDIFNIKKLKGEITWKQKTI